MKSVPARCVILGAGRTGCGFAARLCQRAGWPYVLVDRDPRRVSDLSRGIQVELLDGRGIAVPLHPLGISRLDVSDWHGAFMSAELAFTSVVGSNLGELGRALAPVLAWRCEKAPQYFLNIITLENTAAAGAVIRAAVLENLPHDARRWLNEKVGIVEGMVLCTCLSSENPGVVRSQDFHRLPCDKAAFRGPVPALPGLEPLEGFENQLRRKIYTYNSINAVLSYLGRRAGCRLLHEAARDPSLRELAVAAGAEAGAALVAEYGFDRAEQERWTRMALEKFADANIPDPIARNAADPVRKLSREDRLVGPARLAIKHGIQPHALVQGLLAAIQYRDGDTPTPLETMSGDLQRLLREICGLEKDGALMGFVLEQAGTRSPA